jgi:hypothetical protein
MSGIARDDDRLVLFGVAAGQLVNATMERRRLRSEVERRHDEEESIAGVE